MVDLDVLFEELNKLLNEHDDMLIEHGIIAESERTRIPKFMWQRAVEEALHKTEKETE